MQRKNDDVSAITTMHTLLPVRKSMKRPRQASDSGSDDAFDDGEDLIARAADMMDFNDDEDSGSDESSDAEAEQSQPAKKKQKANGKTKAVKQERDASQEDEEVTSLLQLEVSRDGVPAAGAKASTTRLTLCYHLYDVHCGPAQRPRL